LEGSEKAFGFDSVLGGLPIVAKATQQRRVVCGEGVISFSWASWLDHLNHMLLRKSDNVYSSVNGSVHEVIEALFQ
jgi:hypothetical protein